MVQRKPTPEEQLLKLIEGGGSGAKNVAANPRESSVQEKSKGAFKLGKIPGFLEYFKKGFSPGGFSKGGGITFDIKILNRALLGLVIASAIFLIADLIFFKPQNSKFLAQVSTTDAVYPIRQLAPQRGSSDISVYKNAAQKRNPFLPPSAVVLPGAANSGESTALSPGATGTLTEALQGIKLVGISYSNESPLAMIEDVSTGRTFFLRKGQEVKGVKVQEITKEKVTVTYEGQEGDLF